MPPPQTMATPPPTLCRLCRRPIPRASMKCPYCGARLTWTDRARGIESSRPRRGWRIAAYTTALALLVVAAVIWVSVLREVKAPISSVGDTSKPAGRPTAAECGGVISELTKESAANQPVTPELRDLVRRCLDRR